ncbi:hypothetical protein CMI47_12635 [Candidatus Pacearchaeota archaeon]|nr:hypothetical protein [Candidatus Pacearchaeota archaeon]|tara:strand:- start:4484 stop:5317 length:834 start_codon:yes stop_codon:yes gene_type:complete
MISVFGSTGFVGGKFCEIYPNEIIKISRETRIPQSNNVLYLISTINNYNIFTDPFLDIQTNLNLLIEVLEECKNKSDIIFNFISSWFVYGKTNDLPAKESSYCDPKGFYSITKRAAEQLIISYCETFNINYRILRLCNVYGVTDNKVSKKRNALQYLINEVINNKDIDLYDAGENIRDFLHIEDVCNAIHLVINSEYCNDIINIGSGQPYKFIDIMNYVKDKASSKSIFNIVKPPRFHEIVQVKDMYLDITKLNKIGFKPKYSIYDGLDILIKNLKE